MIKNPLHLITLIIITLGTVQVAAQTKPLNIVTSAVPFLRISTDARAGGMGDVGIATNPDASSFSWNQAKIPFIQRKSGIAASFSPWLRGLGVQDLYLMSVGGYHHLDETQSISGSVKYFSLGKVQFTDENGSDLNSYKPNELSIDAGYSRKLSNKLALGIALRYIHSKLATGTYNGESFKAGSAVAADISLFHDGTGGNPLSSGLNWGVAITNLGSKISYTSDADRKDFIPANLGLGIAYVKVFNEDTKATFGLDVNKLLVPTPPSLSGTGNASDLAAISKYRSKSVISSWFSSFGDAPGGGNEELREVQISAGAEVMFQGQFAVRTGYFYEAPSKGNRKFITIGGGLILPAFNVNFSYLIPEGNSSNRSPLENTIKTTLIFNLGSGK